MVGSLIASRRSVTTGEKETTRGGLNATQFKGGGLIENRIGGVMDERKDRFIKGIL